MRSTCWFNSMYFSHAFLIALIIIKKKQCASHMLKGHMPFLYLGCRKFHTNWFVGNFCPLNIVIIFIPPIISKNKMFKVEEWVLFKNVFNIILFSYLILSIF
jgi:hypothetical protein